ncbi:MAG: methyltransferase domain-containing protein [Ignavibacteria bacterium]|nr:methyltransferase domain-containing protein [Ignavibacteria bacterium]
MDNTIYLPGGVNQFNHLKENSELNEKSILIIGANTESVAKLFLEAGANSVKIIIDDYDLLIKARLVIDRIERVTVKFMEYTNTDFDAATFDIVYAQGSISNSERNKILKEVKRILKSQGIFIVGEYISLTEAAPKYVKDVWENGNILPLNYSKLTEYYKTRNFDVVDVFELSSKLKEFYTTSKKLLNEKVDLLTEQEKIYYKKLLKRINHESNVYLKLGGRDYMGFSSIILRKNQ